MSTATLVTWGGHEDSLKTPSAAKILSWLLHPHRPKHRVNKAHSELSYYNLKKKKKVTQPGIQRAKEGESKERGGSRERRGKRGGKGKGGEGGGKYV